MLSNDESKKLMIRFKKSKNFYKTIKKLEQEGYTCYYSTDNGAIINNIQTKNKIILIGKGKQHLITINYKENKDTTSDYKQNIISIYY